MMHRNQEIEAAKNTETYLSGMTHPQEILDKLERLIGPVRLLITSEDSREVLVQHNISQSDMQTPENLPISRYRTEASIFNRKKKYTIAIDHGDNATSNQIKATDWNDYIKAIIDIYIERMEGLSSQRQHSNLKKIQQQEVKEGMRILSLNRDYSIFLSRVIRSIDPELSADGGYIQDCVRAIDICRVITLRHSRSLAKNAPDIPQLNTIDTISQEIDTILDGRITRRVLRMVTAMLLSRDETMN